MERAILAFFEGTVYDFLSQNQDVQASVDIVWK